MSQIGTTFHIQSLNVRQRYQAILIRIDLEVCIFLRWLLFMVGLELSEGTYSSRKYIRGLETSGGFDCALMESRGVG